MTTGSIATLTAPNSTARTQGFGQRSFARGMAILAAGVIAFLTGCESMDTSGAVKVRGDSGTAMKAEVLTIHEGDALKIAFPGTPTLDSTQTVRRDGLITLPIVGEVKAAGLPPTELEKQLLALFSSQLVSKEVTVTVVSSTFTVFVTGAVVRPGKIVSDHPLTALEAILEAGGYDTVKADLKAVSIIRNEDGKTKTYLLNLKEVLEGKDNDTFMLRPFDKLIIPTKFSWF